MAASRAVSASTSERRNTSAARGDVTDLVTYVGRRNRRALLARGQRADGFRNRLERSDSSAHHEQRRAQPGQHATDTQNNALPPVIAQRPGEVVGQHATAARTDAAQQIRHPPDLPAFGAKHVLVDVLDLAFGLGQPDDRVDIGVDRGAQHVVVRRDQSHVLRRFLGSHGISREQRFGDLVLRAEHIPPRPAGRQQPKPRFHTDRAATQCRDLLGASRNQRRDLVDALAG